MKIYSLPEELEATIPEPDYINQTFEEWGKDEELHRESIREWLQEQGYTGKNSGKIFQEPVADGYAQYMMVEGPVGSGVRSFLLHLPYGDGYHEPNVEFLPKKEVLKRIKCREKVAELFSA
jgi:hypothetical protein